MVFAVPFFDQPPALIRPIHPPDAGNPSLQIANPAIEPDTLLAQAVIPDGPTNVDINHDQITISGGETAGANLFYGFEQFNVPTDATANFLANPSVQRVVGYITGGDSSTIDGLLTITGSTADLFIINPAGILFGANARLDLPATFTAATAHGISFGDRWFSVTGENTIQELSGSPTGLAFSNASGAIVNFGDLSLDDGLMLAASNVLDFGSLRSANGTVQVLSHTSGPVSLRDGLLRLDLPSTPLPADLIGTPVALADLLTGGTVAQASVVNVDAQGNVALGDRPISAGDGVISQVTGESALVVAENNLYLPSSNLVTTEALTLLGERVYMSNRESHPLNLNAGGRLTIQGNEGINVLALYNGQTAITGGEVILASDGEISLDSHISSQGDIRFTTLNDHSADFISLYDPIISANGNVSFGSYEGPALKVEATGSIVVNGNIEITGPDATLTADGSGSDEDLLASSRALILRAGETVLQNPANVPQLNVPTLNTDFVADGSISDPPGITVNGNISTQGTSSLDPGGPVILTALGAITLNGEVDTRTFNISGSITIRGGEIFTEELFAGTAFGDPSSITLTSTTGDIIVEVISAGSGGVDIDAAGLFQATGTFQASPRITLDPGEDDALIAFLQEADPDGFSQLDLNEQVFFVIPTSIATSPEAGLGRVSIRHGGGGNTVNNDDYDIQGTGTVTSTPFFVGPNAEGVTITVDTFGSQRVEGFVPLFAPGEFPTNASGTNGAIAQLTGDGSLATAFLDEPFVPEVPVVPSEPTGPLVQEPQPTGPRVPGAQPPTNSEFSSADADNLEDDTEEETVTADQGTDQNTAELLALRGSNVEDCDADEITQENGVTLLSGDCLEETNSDGPQSALPVPPLDFPSAPAVMEGLDYQPPQPISEDVTPLEGVNL
ncbi:two-partner secretion domain-containing protein [Leptothoe sp. PORK10 BA2]|uniref:two-partner secretion domain-containing protein n=1 Tax=Leptothoe sp. PORK10 BA2 TaxID=3110254 RepID=UPI002B1FB4C8|nr:filamentous hemagglutinin N-terminal domain-containing protein [Leptothoe sp. PORK10 BA2]MEA5462362.1 filamentous hemagglutinin N-terminal domain-containing protein [Leptothoe sp. PORK10 BA2]